MEVLHSPAQSQAWTHAARRSGRTVGIVPTMGALHAGHLSLVQSSRNQCDSTIATIFVNPTQFGPGEDYQRYPRTWDEDCRLLREHGVDAVFAPSVEDMYPDGFSTYVQPPTIAQTLEGVCRPGHFRGVTTVVSKLFHAVPGTHAFFGQKDYQQWKVIEAMTRDLNVGIQIIGCPIVREDDGLALSSRNQYLDSNDRARALLLWQALRRVKEMFRNGERSALTMMTAMRDILSGRNHGDETASSNVPNWVDRIDYALIADAESLRPIRYLDRPAVALIAAYVGQTRLIDNCVLE